MKTHSILSILILVLVAVVLTAAGAFAGGKLPYDKSGLKVPIQNFQGTSPDAAASTCTTATVTKGTLATVPTEGYLGMEYSVTDSAGTAVSVKRHLNSNSAYMPGSSGRVAFNSSFSTVAFKPYSAAPRALTICSELQ